jgi:hypothetical protein
LRDAVKTSGLNLIDLIGNRVITVCRQIPLDQPASRLGPKDRRCCPQRGPLPENSWSIPRRESGAQQRITSDSSDSSFDKTTNRGQHRE